MNEVYMGRAVGDNYYCFYPINSNSRREFSGRVGTGLHSFFRGGVFLRSFLTGFPPSSGLTIFPQEKEIPT